MNDYILHMNDGTVLCHHGVKGMKWGIRRYEKLRTRNQKEESRLSDKESSYRNKALIRSKKAAKWARAAEYLGKSNHYARKASRKRYKASKLDLKRSKLDPNSIEYAKITKRMAKRNYKATRLERRAVIRGKDSVRNHLFNRLSYRNQKKADKLIYKAEKTKYKEMILNSENVSIGKKILELQMREDTEND